MRRLPATRPPRGDAPGAGASAGASGRAAGPDWSGPRDSSRLDGFRPLLACYGGGHGHIMTVLAQSLAARGAAPQVIGLTTGYRMLVHQGIAAQSVEALLTEDDAPYLAMAEPFVGTAFHPAVTRAQTRAYFALGLRDLVERLGRTAALRKIEAEGRKAFEPVTVWQRHLRRTRPDIVVATTCPRFETALLKAARCEGLPNLAVGDLFLVPECDRLRDPDYAENLSVLNCEVARTLRAGGFPGRLRVTGNPAFDRLAPHPGDAARRRALRARLGLTDKTVILWPAAGDTTGSAVLRFTDPAVVVAAFEALSAGDSGFAYVIRTHPNHPFQPRARMVRGILDDGSDLTAEDAILIADIVCVEASTMGLQAALAGKPVICVGYSDYISYPRHGLAASAGTLAEAVDLIARRAVPAPAVTTLGMPPLGSATGNVIDFMLDIVRDHAGDGVAPTGR